MGTLLTRSRRLARIDTQEQAWRRMRAQELGQNTIGDVPAASQM